MLAEVAMVLFTPVPQLMRRDAGHGAGKQQGQARTDQVRDGLLEQLHISGHSASFDPRRAQSRGLGCQRALEDDDPHGGLGGLLTRKHAHRNGQSGGQLSAKLGLGQRVKPLAGRRANRHVQRRAGYGQGKRGQDQR